MNQSVTYSELRQSLKSYLDGVCNDHLPLLVKRGRGEDVVIMSKDDYSALEETAYLLRSPENAKRLMEAISRDPKDRISFDNVEELKDEIGL